MFYDIRAKLLIEDIAGSADTRDRFIAAVEEEVRRRHACVIDASFDRLHF